MKRLFILTAVMAVTASAKAQLKLYELKTKKPAQKVYTYQLPQADSTFKVDFAILNADSTKAKNIKVVRTTEKLAAGQTTNFCFVNNCYPPATRVSAPERIKAGGTIPAKAGQFGLQADLTINNIAGITIVRYRIQDISDPADTVSVTLVYKVSASGSPGLTKNLIITSARVNPNPANSTTFVNFTLAKAAAVSVTVYNAQGAMVFSRNYGMLNGEQKLPVNTSAFLQGLYRWLRR